MYKLIIRPILFLVSPEKIHHIVFGILQFGGKIPGFKALLRAMFNYQSPLLERTLFGVTFKNPVGLAAGFDKDARLVDVMECMGFGSIEIGTVTPLPQPGNPLPRMFRLPKDKALINRMGFNNEGVYASAERLRTRKSTVTVGGNIGKNKNTPNEKAATDYSLAYDGLYQYVDYFVINVSSPNTPGLRELQDKEPLTRLLNNIKTLSLTKSVKRPVLLKIAPDLTDEQLADIVVILKETKIDGVIATNTTISREGLQTDDTALKAIGNGGLSGAPVRQRSTDVIRFLRTSLGPDFPIIGVGGIATAEDAIEKIEAGADLVQVYTGFIYEGPAIAKKINKALVKKLSADALPHARPRASFGGREI